ncbi:putative transcription factor C2H2 family [Rosa chinensis]|uniref:Putative transcription factor C2H2 family n=1 Tax=Rosa chinensis TaxID=74649 RepID=A0A2P6RI55_ROSCH|nr:uncharacterized protein LOC112185447 [Rosa chinensis]PRQ46106.1 putative transcription factor C2H2 family [Rosa chinensis]
MEFKFRAVDVSDRPSPPSSSTVRYFSSERTIRGQSVLPTWAVTPSSGPRTGPDPTGFPNPDYLTIHDPILHPTNARDAMQRQMEKDRIREEILAAEMVRRRVLEAEVRRELMLEREIAMKKAVRDGLGFEDDPFGPMQAHSFDHRFGFSPRSSSPLAMVPRLPEPVPDNNLEVNKELTPPAPARPPELNKDKLIVLAKPNPNLSGLKRKKLPSEGANEIYQYRLKKKKIPKEELKKKKKIPKEEWSCALCQVTVANEKMFDGHLNGKRHKASEKRLGAEKLGKSSSNAPLSKNTAKPFEPKELETTGAASSQLGAKEERGLLDHNEAGDGSDKKMQDTDTSEEKKVELPVQKDQCGEDLKNNVEVKKVHMMQRKEEPTKTKKFEFLCEICKVGSNNPKVMEKHSRAKKHMDRLEELKSNKVRTTNEANVNTPTTKSVASSGAMQEAVKRLQQDTESSFVPTNVIKEANASIPTTISVASLVVNEKAENARLQESINVTKEANVSTPTTNSAASSGATQEAVKRLQQDTKNSVAPANVTKEANASIPVTIAVASLRATGKAETARLQESANVTKETNVSIPTAAAVTSWGASEETETARLLDESIKNKVPTTNVTTEANANMQSTTSISVESFWFTETAENLRKLEAYEKLIKARLTE